jgi:hypothetical protein
MIGLRANRVARKPSKLFSKNKRVKAVARERVGAPKPVRVLEERTRKSQPKHKRTWLQASEDYFIERLP